MCAYTIQSYQSLLFAISSNSHRRRRRRPFHHFLNEEESLVIYLLSCSVLDWLQQQQHIKSIE